MCEFKAYLIVEKGTPHYLHQTFVVTGPRFTIGRATESNHPDLSSVISVYLSRKHAEIKYNVFHLTDISKYGAKINGMVVEKAVPKSSVLLLCYTFIIDLKKAFWYKKFRIARIRKIKART